MREISIKEITIDAVKRRSPFAVSQAIEDDYARALRKVGKVAGNLVGVHLDADGNITDLPAMVAALEAYAKTIGPWAERQAFQMVQRTLFKNRKAWEGLANKMGKALKIEINHTPTGKIAQELVTKNVGLIQTIPRDAAARAQKLAIGATQTGKRASETAAELMKSTQVSESNAVRIARTETARANSAINRARAQSVGADDYTWQTMQDGDVRETHADMQDEVCSYNDPPAPEGEENYNPGEIYNCRCFAEPILSKLEDA